MNHNLELLNDIIISTKSQNKVSDAPVPTTSVGVGDNKKISVSSASEFSYSLFNPDENNTYHFKVRISRITHSYMFKNWDDEGSRYITSIRVMYRGSRYSSWDEKDEFIYDSQYDNTCNVQKDLYKFLLNSYLTELNIKKNEKINTYLKEARKLHSKDVVRDEKLDKLLS